MILRNALLESALDSMPDGLAVLDSKNGVAFWNAAAKGITGYAGSELDAAGLPSGLKMLLQLGPQRVAPEQPPRGVLVRMRHKLGHQVPVIARSLALHNGEGEEIGTTVLFHPAEHLDALPHGDLGDDQAVAASQVEFEKRLEAEFEDFERGGQPMGVLWIGVDQGHDLRRTHGVAACHTMIEKVERALASGLRPAEELGRWGEAEFLILAHERTPEMLARHACTLATMARTADFRWWGDRISLTVSIGAAQAGFKQPLTDLLERARKAMETSMRAGGNRATCAPSEYDDASSAGEDLICTPS